MYRSRLGLALLTTLVVCGCSTDAPATPTSVTAPDEDAVVNAPWLTPEDFVSSTYVVHEADSVSGEPARATFEGGGDLNEAARIIDPDTRGWFETDLGYAGMYGRHDYIGNVSSIRTTGRLTYNDQYLGTQSAERQDYTPFLLDFGRRKHIWVYPKIYADHQCGLTVQGDSTHRAWWEFYQGTGVSTWGRVAVSTQQSPMSQGACSSGNGGYESDRQDGGGLVCTYWITYDVNSGEILSAELLYCSSTGGELV